MAAEPTPEATEVPLSPTCALDRALEFLAQNDAEGCLRLALPTLGDQGAGAAALDLVGRAAVMLGSDSLARRAFTLAARSLARGAVAGHSLAAALAVHRLCGDDSLLSELARVLGADAPRDSESEVQPPPLGSEPVTQVARSVSRQDLLQRATLEVEAIADEAALPLRSRHSLWGALPTGALERFAKALKVRLCPARTRVFTEGSHGGSVFVIARGEVQVVQGEGAEAVTLASLGPEGVFGEFARLASGRRAATVITVGAAILLEAPREALDAAANEASGWVEMLDGLRRARQIENLWRTSALLKGVPEAEREALIARFETLNFAKGEVLISQGSEAPGLHLVVSGRVQVSRVDAIGGAAGGGAEPLRVATVSPGGCVGEVSLVLHRPAAATVRAIEDTRCLVLRPAQFMDVVRAYPKVLVALYELAVARDHELFAMIDQEALDAGDLVIV